jgi:hypothetical protein
MDTWLQSHLASVETIMTAGFTPMVRGSRNGPVQFQQQNATHARPRAPHGSEKTVGFGIRYLEEIIKGCKGVGKVYNVTGVEGGGGKAKIELLPTDEKATMSLELVREVAEYVLKL